jgi:hypothetical protein
VIGYIPVGCLVIGSGEDIEWINLTAEREGVKICSLWSEGCQNEHD